jgi:hypothetical protein
MEHPASAAQSRPQVAPVSQSSVQAPSEPHVSAHVEVASQTSAAVALAASTLQVEPVKQYTGCVISRIVTVQLAPLLHVSWPPVPALR